MRYVWAAVAISMFLIFLIWIFSLQEMFKSSQPEQNNLSDLKDKFQSQKQDIPSLQDFMKQGDKLMQGNANNQNTSPTQGSNSLNQEGVKQGETQSPSGDNTSSGGNDGDNTSNTGQ